MPGTGRSTSDERINGIHVDFTTVSGKPAQIDGKLTLSVQSGTATFEQNGGPQDFDVISSEDLGDTVFVVEADSDLDATGVKTIRDTYTYTVVSPEAANFGFSGGTVVAK